MRTGRKIPIITIILLISITLNFNVIVIGDNGLISQSHYNFGTRGINSTGDWQISNTTITSDDTIILAGNLSIEPGDNLTLRNVNLKLNCTANGTYHIDVKSGGTLHIDNSNITVNNPEYQSYWNVQKGSNFSMNNTEVSNFGWDEKYLGLEIKTNRSYIENCNFTNCHVGVAFIYSDSGQVINCRFKDNFYSIYLENSSLITIQDCEISNGISGIVMVNSSFSDINNCLILSHKDPGIFIYNSYTLLISNCEVKYHIYSYYDFKAKGIFIKESADITIFNCKLINNSNGVYIENSYLVVVENCEILNNIDSGINIYFSSLNGVFNCTILSNSYGITLWSGNSCLIENCNISANEKAGSHLMNANNNKFKKCGFYDNRDGAFFNGISTNNKFINCSIANSINYDFNTTHEANIITINTTFNKTKNTIAANSNLTINWYLNLHLIDNLGNQTPNATVQLQDQLKDIVYNVTTDSNGKLNWLVLTELFETTDNITYFSPYLLTAKNDSLVNTTEVLLDYSKELIIVLEEPPEPAPDDDKDKDDDEQFFTEDLCICVSIFIIIFMAILLINSYLMKRKYAKSGHPGIEGGHAKIPVDKVKCSECDALVPADASSCPRCGEPFEGEEFECPGCGATLTEDATECKKCGKQFQASSKLELEDDEEHTKKEAGGKFYCSDCGGVIDEQDTFCPACGELFEDETKPKKLKPRKKLKKGKAIDQEFMCSVCGAQVSGGASRCPKCKTEFD